MSKKPKSISRAAKPSTTAKAASSSSKVSFGFGLRGGMRPSGTARPSPSTDAHWHTSGASSLKPLKGDGPGELSIAFARTRDLALKLADAEASTKLSFENFAEYWTYLFNATTSEAFEQGKFPGERRARHKADFVDEALASHWKKFIGDVEAIYDSSALPSAKCIRNVLHDLIGNATVEKLLLQYLNITVSEILDAHDKPLKRIYRSRAELPDPTKPANAPVNLRRKQVALRFLPELTQAMDTALERDGNLKTRNDWVNEAVSEKLRREHPDLLGVIASEPTTPKR